MIPEIPSIDPTSTCLHAVNPQAKLARGREKSATLLLAEFATFYAKRETSPWFTAPGESFAVEFVKICRYKHFGRESLNLQPSCCLDVVVYMLNCVFWRHILLEIEFKSRVDMGSDSNRYTAQWYSPWAAAQLSKREKIRNRKIERGEFITPPRPTGRRSNEQWRSFKLASNG